jgi:hypothetical protein
VESAVSELMRAGRGFLPRKMVSSPECGCVFVPMKSILGRLHTAPRSQAALSLVCLFVLILVVRLIIPGPITEPDSDTYSELGRNLMQYHCFGWVDEETGVCSPIWGTQPPGYPLLLGAVQATGPQSLYYVVLIQTVIFAIAATYALWAAYAWHKSLTALLISGAILALSPATIAWPRWVLTETIAAASVLWVFAEIFRSLALQRLRIAQLSLALATATLVRWDQIWLLVPAAACAIYMGHRNPLNVCRQIGILGFGSGLVILFMVLRAATVGLPLSPAVDEDLTKGAREFWTVAAKNQSLERGFLWPMGDKRYAQMASRFDYSSLAPGFDMARLHAVISRISALPQDTDLPRELDAELSDLARNPSPKAWSRFHLLAYRVMAIWTQADNFYESGWKTSPEPNGAEYFVRPYRIALVVFAAALLLISRGEQLFILGCLLAYVALRTCFFAFFGLLESRYLVPMLSSMELVLATAAIVTILRVSTPAVGRPDQTTQEA